MSCREFSKSTLLVGDAIATGGLRGIGAEPTKRVRTVVIGRGSVFGACLPVITKSPYIEVTS